MSAIGSKAEDICSQRVFRLLPSRPEEFRLEPLTDPDLILSHHPARIIAPRLPPFPLKRQAPPGLTQLAQLNGDDPPPSLHRHYPLHHYYRAVRPSPAHRYFQPRGWSRLRFFPWHRRPGSHVPYKSQIELRAVYMPDAAWAVSVHPPSLSRKMGQPPVLTSSKSLSTLHRRFTCVRLSQSCLRESCFGFSATFTTIAFDDSSLRWLGFNTLLPTSKDLPSSPVQLRIAVWTGVTRDTRPITTCCTGVADGRF